MADTSASRRPGEAPTGRASQLLIVLLGSVASLSFSLITWIGVLTLGAQPEVWCLSDDPLSPAFWQSNDWAGVALKD